MSNLQIVSKLPTVLELMGSLGVVEAKAWDKIRGPICLSLLNL
jgi:hypothetical protein